MKSAKALVVVHDEETRVAVDEVMGTLGFKYEVACNLIEAKNQLAANGYGLLITDSAIPYRAGAKPRLQNLEHLLEATARAKPNGMPPVIILASPMPDVHDEDKFRWAADMGAKGAQTFICKPLPSCGRTLDRVIRKIMSGQTDQFRPRSAGRPVDGDDGPVAAEQAASTPDKRKAVQAKAQAEDRGRWASIPNEPVDLETFMGRFCEPRSKENRKCRKRALLAAARHGTVALPPIAGPRKPGQANRYLTQDLLAAWPGFVDAGVEVPPLLPQ